MLNEHVPPVSAEIAQKLCKPVKEEDCSRLITNKPLWVPSPVTKKNIEAFLRKNKAGELESHFVLHPDLQKALLEIKAKLTLVSIDGRNRAGIAIVSENSAETLAAWLFHNQKLNGPVVMPISDPAINWDYFLYPQFHEGRKDGNPVFTAMIEVHRALTAFLNSSENPELYLWERWQRHGKEIFQAKMAKNSKN